MLVPCCYVFLRIFLTTKTHHNTTFRTLEKQIYLAQVSQGGINNSHLCDSYVGVCVWESVFVYTLSVNRQELEKHTSLLIGQQVLCNCMCWAYVHMHMCARVLYCDERLPACWLMSYIKSVADMQHVYKSMFHFSVYVGACSLSYDAGEVLPSDTNGILPVWSSQALMNLSECTFSPQTPSTLISFYIYVLFFPLFPSVCAWISVDKHYWQQRKHHRMSIVCSSEGTVSESEVNKLTEKHVKWTVRHYRVEDNVFTKVLPETRDALFQSCAVMTTIHRISGAKLWIPLLIFFIDFFPH